MNYNTVRISYLAAEIEDVARRVRAAARAQDEAELAALAAQGRIIDLSRRLDTALRPGRPAHDPGPLSEAELYGAYKAGTEAE